MDVINLETERFETVNVADVLAEFGRDVPAISLIASVCDADGVYGPVGFDWDPNRQNTIVTFEGLISQTPFLPRMRALLKLLREKMGVPVDIEFASDGKDFYLLQCRPQSFAQDAVPAPIPRDVAPDRVIFSANRCVSNGHVPDITHIVYVDPDAYAEIASLAHLRDVGRAVGRLNKMLPKHQFVLMGPGRWGSRGDIKLGVNVTYSDINNTAVLMEIAARRGAYAPDLSFGTHFFQDLVESSIRYLPLFPEEPGTVLNELFLRRAPNILADILPEFRHLALVVRVIDVPRTTNGQILRVLMNADLDEAVGLLATPAAEVTTGVERHREVEPLHDDHWRWRLQMAEQIAAEIDPVRFGIVGLYVFGSAKNATAGPQSDIDLLVHFRGDDAARRDLEHWLEGWSLCLSEVNYLRTGYKTDGLLDVHIITDEDIARQDLYAMKIGAVTDAARPLTLKKTH
jgi:predicted nucleotidyltransferase